MAADPFGRRVEIRRGRRRSIEVTLENGQFVARVPMRASLDELEPVVEQLRIQLLERLQRESIFDQDGLQQRAEAVARRDFASLELPPFTVRFSRRQHKRWGSCTFNGSSGRIRISAHLIGHPVWVIDSVLLHEMAHLIESGHGPRFSAIVERSSDHERARGYLEALETVDRLGQVAPLRWAARVDDTENDDARHKAGHRVQGKLFSDEA